MRHCFLSTDLDGYFQLQDSLANAESQHYSFFVLPHEPPESSTIDAYVGKHFHCILYNDKGKSSKNIDCQLIFAKRIKR